MKITVWGNEGCASCERLKHQLREMGLSYGEKHIDDMYKEEKGKRRDILAAYAMEGALPVVEIDGEMYSAKNAIAFIRKAAAE